MEEINAVLSHRSLMKQNKLSHPKVHLNSKALVLEKIKYLKTKKIYSHGKISNRTNHGLLEASSQNAVEY